MFFSVVLFFWFFILGVGERGYFFFWFVFPCFFRAMDHPAMDPLAQDLCGIPRCGCGCVVLCCVVLWCVGCGVCSKFSWVPSAGPPPPTPPPPPDRPKWGFTRQPKNSKRAHLRVPTCRERKKEWKQWRESEKKREILGHPSFEAPPFGTPAFQNPLRDPPPPDSPHCFWVVVNSTKIVISTFLFYFLKIDVFALDNKIVIVTIIFGRFCIQFCSTRILHLNIVCPM